MEAIQFLHKNFESKERGWTSIERYPLYTDIETVFVLVSDFANHYNILQKIKYNKMNKKLKAGIYTFLLFLMFGLLYIMIKYIPHETEIILLSICLCYFIFMVYKFILSSLD
jgi:hypothetical protein